VDQRHDEEILGARVLIADDDPAFRKMLARRVLKMGLSVVEVENGDQAVEALRNASFDLILIDLSMPGKNGLEVIHKALQLDPMLPAVVITGTGSYETALEALRSRVFDYMTKPLETLTAFELTVTRALKHGFLARDNARSFARAQLQATTDPLTGISNRHKLKERLETEVARARRYRRALSILLMDLDGLKSINDTCGHPAGDEALQHVARSLKMELRKTDLPGRYGGDEFLVLLPETDAVHAVAVARRILARVHNCRVGDKSISVSIGIAQLDGRRRTPNDLILAADRALYSSKRSGGGQISVEEARKEDADVLTG
jgi:two-component system cell cycle response regulator